MHYKYILILSLFLFSSNSFGYARVITLKNKGNQTYQNSFETQLLTKDSKFLLPQRKKNKKILSQKRKAQRRKNRRAKLKNRKIFKQKRHKSFDTRTSTFFVVLGLILKCLGVIAFALGFLYFSPLIWIALGIFILGSVLAWACISNAEGVLGLFSLIEISLGIGGIVFFIISLTLGIMTLWIGGIVFLLGALTLVFFILFIYISMN